jgi:predicted DCC family thiol-disulfide oxidoreductase YuxK
VTKRAASGPREGWILYDDSCGICRWWAMFLEDSLRRRGFEIAPLQAEWVIQQLELKEADLLSDLRLLKPDRSQLLGANAYRYTMRRIWWAWPLYLLAIVPGFRNIFNWSYRAFADNRHRISRTCGLKK